MDINECGSVPCQHGGSCADAVASYTCHCEAGYSGSRCEIDIDECGSVPCQHGGMCVDAVASYYHCECADGHDGTNCANEIDLCTRSEDQCDKAVSQCMHMGPGKHECACFFG